MFPDFAKAKARTQRDFLRSVERQVPNLTPLLQGIAKFRQHEGRNSQLTRLDDSTQTTNYRRAEFSFTMSREEHKHFDPSSLVQKLVDAARKIGEDQTKHMLEAVGKAADEVGNVVHADGELTKDKFLDVLRRVAMDFDPKTLEIAPGFMWVMHPDMAAKVVPRMQEWEKDPEFNAKHERLMELKREEWRDREARRKLVD